MTFFLFRNLHLASATNIMCELKLVIAPCCEASTLDIMCHESGWQWLYSPSSMFLLHLVKRSFLYLLVSSGQKTFLSFRQKFSLNASSLALACCVSLTSSLLITERGVGRGAVEGTQSCRQAGWWNRHASSPPCLCHLSPGPPFSSSRWYLPFLYVYASFECLC